MLEENPYYDVVAISNSSLSNINAAQGGHCKKYKAFISGDLEKKNTLSLERGKLLHKWIENSEAFVISDIDAPHEEAVKWLTIVLNKEKEWIEINQEVIPKEIFEEFILEAKKQISFHDNYRKAEVIINLFNSFSEYYNFIKYPSDKICLSSATRNILLSTYTSLYTHPIAHKLLFEPLMDLQVLNEQAIYFDINGVKCKSLLDRVIIDHKYKNIKIIDLKTTSKAVSNYPNEFIYYRTYRQLAFYKKAIVELLKQLNYVEIETYEIECIIVAVETVGQFTTQVFNIHSDWIDKGTEEYLQLIDLINWHTQTDNWELTKEEYLGTNVLEYNEFKYLKNQ